MFQLYLNVMDQFRFGFAAWCAAVAMSRRK